MGHDNLEQLLQEEDDLIGMMRENGGKFNNHFPVIPKEVTNWIDEQRAIVETCALGDLSHHMTPVHVTGPDALEFFRDLSANSFAEFEIGRAKQIVLCSPDGYLMGDGPLLRLGKEEFWGVPTCSNWVRYHVETGGYDITAEFDPPSSARDGDPDTFIYQVQGPNSLEVLKQLTDATLEDIPFYRFERIELAGRDVRAFGHGMNTEVGFEFHGPYDYAGEIRDAILEAGEEYGIRHLGTAAYMSQSVRLGWISAGPPPIYDSDELREYRQWLDTESSAANYSLEGSFDSDDISDYYMDPVEYGYGRLIDFDHDFIGREAVKEKLESRERQFVSMIWDDDEVDDVYGSLFGDGDHHKFVDLPRPRWAHSAYDEVRKDGELVGLSQRRSYQPDIRGMVSLGVVDNAFSEPGTEVTVVWGEGPASPNPKIEEHAQTEISATIEAVPYTEDRRK